MDGGRLSSYVAVAGILLFSLVGGPAVGAVDGISERPDELGEGTASVGRVDFSADDIRLTKGRFGTGVLYLRIPPIQVTILEASGRSRLVYGVSVPALDFERVSTQPVSPNADGVLTVRMADRAFPRESIERQKYSARVTVRVQSFSEDEQVFARNVTVQVIE